MGYIVGQEFEGDETCEARVLGLIHDTHAPATDFFDHEVMRESLAIERAGRHGVVMLVGDPEASQRIASCHLEFTAEC